MNRWQVAKQFVWLLGNKTWPDAPNEPVFSKAVVSDLPIEVVYTSETVPFVLVRPQGADKDGEHPEHASVQRFEIAIAAEGWTDLEGASALVGGNRVAPSGGLSHQGTSQGRGLLELEELARQALTSLDGSGGMVSACTVGSSNELTIMPGGVLVSVVRLAVEVYNTTRDRTYAYPIMLKASGAGGVVSLTWSLPPSRWDSLGLVLVYQSGTSAPSAPNLGTPVSVTPTQTTASVTTGTGTWSFALFSSYDETGNGVAERYSSSSPIANATGIAA